MDMKVTDGLGAEQIRLEKDALGLGIERYRKEASRDQAATPPGRRLLREAVKRMVQTLPERIEDLLRGRATRTSDFLQQFDPALLARATATACIKEMYFSERAAQTVALELAEVLESTINYKAVEKANPKLYRRLLARTERASNSGSRGLILRKFLKEAGVIPIQWSEVALAHVGMWLLDAFCHSTQMATIETVQVRPKSGRPTSKTIIKPTDGVKQQLEEDHAKAESMHPRMFPMIVPPRDWTTPINGGYLTNALRKAAVKRAHPGFLKDMYGMSIDMVYTAMNTLQRTAWVVNADVYGVLDAAWNGGSKTAGLPTKEKTPVPPRVENPDANADQYKARQVAAAKAHRENHELRNIRRDVDGNLAMAKRMRGYGRFYFVYTMDRRGRLYAASDYLSPQGTDISKALLKFADGVALGENGAHWLAVHGANCSGMGGVDKESFADRVQWVLDNEQEIIKSATVPLKHGWWEAADEPWQFLAFCMEWQRLSAWRAQGGRDEDFISHLPVSVDGTCNGLQHLSMLMRDELGGAATNLVPGEKPGDIYRQVADKFRLLVGPEAAAWDDKVSRDLAKKPTMTTTYGSTQAGTRKQLAEVLGAIEGLTGDSPYEAAVRLAPLMREAIRNVCGRAVEAMKWLQDVARVFAKDGLPIRWTTPSGFMVVHQYIDVVGKKLDVTIGGVRHQLTLSVDGAKLDKRKQVSAIVANYVHSLDAAHLVRTVKYAREAGVMAFAMVHDSYGTHAGTMDVLHRELRRAFVVQYRHPYARLAYLPEEALFDFMPEGPTGPIPPAPQLGGLDPGVVMESKYLFS